jgi:hypothetical protein
MRMIGNVVAAACYQLILQALALPLHRVQAIMPDKQQTIECAASSMLKFRTVPFMCHAAPCHRLCSICRFPSVVRLYYLSTCSPTCPLHCSTFILSSSHCFMLRRHWHDAVEIGAAHVGALVRLQASVMFTEGRRMVCQSGRLHEHFVRLIYMCPSCWHTLHGWEPAPMLAHC